MKKEIKNKEKGNLLMFNLGVDENHSALGFTTTWLNELSPHFNEITLICNFKGSININKNIIIHSIGAEKGNGKLLKLLKFYTFLIRSVQKKKYISAFAHMTPLMAVLSFPILRILKIPIVLWYAHPSVSLTVWIAERLVSKVVTSNKMGFQLISEKKLVIGHGVRTEKNLVKNTINESNPMVVVYIARISRIKNQLLAVQAIHHLRKFEHLKNIKLKIVGSAQTKEDHIYENEILKFIKLHQLTENVELTGPRNFSDIPHIIKESRISLNFMSGSFDKAALETMTFGRPLIYTNVEFNELLEKASVESSKYYWHCGSIEGLTEKIQNILEAEKEEIQNDCARIASLVENEHGLQKLSVKLSKILKSTSM